MMKLIRSISLALPIPALVLAVGVSFAAVGCASGPRVSSPPEGFQEDDPATFSLRRYSTVPVEVTQLLRKGDNVEVGVVEVAMRENGGSPVTQYVGSAAIREQIQTKSGRPGTLYYAPGTGPVRLVAVFEDPGSTYYLVAYMQIDGWDDAAEQQAIEMIRSFEK